MTPKKRSSNSQKRIKSKTGKKKNLHNTKQHDRYLAKVLGSIKWEKAITLLVFIAVALVVLIGPLKRGLFFEIDYIPFLIISFSLFLLWWITKLLRGDASLVKTPLDLFVLLFLFGYLLSLFTALHPRPALGEFLKVAYYAALYYIISDLCRQHALFSNLPFIKARSNSDSEPGNLYAQPASVFLFVIALSGYGLAAGGLLNAAGVLSIPHAYLAGRITTPIGYANTGAAYLMSTYFIATGLGLLIERWYLRPLFMAPLVLSIITIIFSYSRGVWFIFPFFILLFCILSLSGKRLLALGYSLAAFAVSLPFVFLLNKTFNDENSMQAIFLILLAMLAMVIGGYLTEFMVNLSLKRKITLGIILALVILTGTIYLGFSSPGLQLQRVLPEDIYSNIFSRVESVDLRIAHTSDAFKIIREYPVFGVGGGGWEVLYRSYQDIPYSTISVHNHFLEVWVESGLLGFLSFVAIWIAFIMIYIKFRFKQPGMNRLKQLWTSIFVAAVALGAHSAFDWNLSYTAVSIYLFMLFALCNSYDPTVYKALTLFSERYFRPFRTIGIVLVFFISIYLFIYSIFLSIGFNATLRSQEMLEANNLKDAERELNKAIRFDPLRADNYHNRSGLIESQLHSLGVRVYWPEYHYLIEKAYELEPYNTLYLARYAYLQLGTENTDEGLARLRQLIDLRPFQPERYQEYAESVISLTDPSVNSIPDEARQEYLHEILALEQVMIDRTGSSEPLYYFIGKAHYLLGNYSEALNYLVIVKPGDQYFEESVRLTEAIE